MIEGKWYSPGSDIEVSLELRKKSLNLIRDEIDYLSWQLVVFDDGEPVGAGRIWWQDGDFYIGAVSVLKDKRGMGFGDLLVRLLLYKAQEHNALRVLIKPCDSVGFFTKYGFSAIDENTENGIMALYFDKQMLSPCQKV